uniref:Uncharacterized protein n=1 Tax=Anopheles minimus TaxID=112268 RepID=A0A182W6F7_9DIPT
MRWFKRSTESPKLLSLSPLRHSESGNVYGGNEPSGLLHRHDHDRTAGTTLHRRRSAGDGGDVFGMNPDGDGEHGEVLAAGLSNSPSSASTTSGSSGSSGSSPSMTNSSSSCTSSSSPFSYTSDSKCSSSGSNGGGGHKILQSGTATTPRKSRIDITHQIEEERNLRPSGVEVGPR